MKRQEILDRAHYAAAHSKATYELGKGGYSPTNELPEGSTKTCDCSGFVSWVIGESRKTGNAFLKSLNGGWIETTAVVKDAKSEEGMFTKIDAPEPGCLFVWGDNSGKQGHIGVVTEVAFGTATKVIHCSSGNSRKYGKAIKETAADIFYHNGGIFVKFDKMED